MLFLVDWPLRALKKNKAKGQAANEKKENNYNEKEKKICYEQQKKKNIENKKYILPVRWSQLPLNNRPDRIPSLYVHQIKTPSPR